MADETNEFFEALRRRKHEPLLEQATGTLRLELAANGGTSTWFVSVDKGDLAISHERRKADCTARSDRELFDRIVRGEANAMAAVLRGAVEIEGDLELLMLFQRLFPGPRDQVGAGAKEKQ